MPARAPNRTGGRVQVTIRLPPDLYAWAVKEADRSSRTLTSVVELAVRQYMETTDATKP